MLFLLFKLGKDRYVLEAARVVEVLPLLDLKALPEAPKGVAGLFSYHGQAVPAVDLSEMTTGRPSSRCLSTRIILINYPDEAGKSHPVGLIAEQATEVIRRDTGDFVESGMPVGAPAYLGPVLMDSLGMIQWIHERRLLPERVCDLLFSETAEGHA